MKIQGGSVKLPPSLWGQAYFLRAKRGNPVAVPDCFGTIVPRKDKKESAWERQKGESLAREKGKCLGKTGRLSLRAKRGNPAA